MARPTAPAGPPAGGPPPAGPQGPRRGGLLARIGGSRNGAILAAGATVAVVALLSVLRGKGGKADEPAPTPVQAGDGFDSGPYDMWNQWEQQYEDLAGRVGDLENPPKAPPPVQVQKPISTLPAPIASPPPVKPPVRVAQPSKPKPATPKTKTYTVKKGDTLSGIAKKLGISMATLKKLNPVYWTNPKYDHGNKIWSGDKVKYA